MDESKLVKLSSATSKGGTDTEELCTAKLDGPGPLPLGKLVKFADPLKDG